MFIDNVKIRWCVNKDIEEVLKIENEAGEHHWNEFKLKNILNGKSTIGLVATVMEYVDKYVYNRIVGFMIYELTDTEIIIKTLSVDAPFRRKGIGSKFINWVENKLDNKRNRNKISFTVRDSNLPCHLFLKNLKFKANKVIKNHYKSKLLPNEFYYEDGYIFVYDKNFE